ncbi:hypothetical protein N5079_35170, partial [Planotetraspora sp. A-T 1434]|uniref:hypothetical protein n=1 Tax=Planotetraspora sp. A-T 1434 TaxID=2979219 RepID=UPI0021BE9FEA
AQGAEAATAVDSTDGSVRAGDAGVRRAFQLAVPYDTWAGNDERAGLLHGYGPLTPDQARQLATLASTWVATRTPHGHIILHAKITTLTKPRTQHTAIRTAIHAIDTTHPPEPRYRPSQALTARVRARDLTCRNPICNRSAYSSDLDHTRP